MQMFFSFLDIFLSMKDVRSHRIGSSELGKRFAIIAHERGRFYPFLNRPRN
jgi:hypothetical protein